MNDDSIIFRTPRVTRIASLVFYPVMWSCICLVLCIGVSIVAAFARQSGVSLLLSVGFGLVACLLVARWAFHRLIAAVRFRVVLSPAACRVGGNWFGCVFPYPLVEVLSVFPAEREPGIELIGAGCKASVRLSLPDQMECANLLLELCPNAVYVDEHQMEHLPPGGDRPELTLLALCRRLRSLLVRTVYGALLSAALTFAAVAEFLEQMRPDNARVGAWELSLFGIALAGSGVSVYVTVVLMRGYWRELTAARRALDQWGLEVRNAGSVRD